MNRIPDGIDFEKYLRECVGPDESVFLAPAPAFRDRLLQQFNPTPEMIGQTLPWEDTHDDIRLRPGEVSLWGGYNGHLKSTLTLMVATWLIRDTSVLVASMEMEPEYTLQIMAQQASGLENPKEYWIDQWFLPNAKRLTIYDQMDEVEGIRILGMIEYAARELGCKHIFIDSKMMLGLAEDGQGWLTAEKEFMQRLVWSARRTGAHIHLIVHVRKPEHGGTQKIPTKYDISGGASWSNLAHNVFIAWRNEKREDLVRKNASIDDINEAGPAFVLSVDKQRKGKFRGMKRLFYNDKNRQFTRVVGKPVVWLSHQDKTVQSISRYVEKSHE